MIQKIVDFPPFILANAARKWVLMAFILMSHSHGYGEVVYSRTSSAMHGLFEIRQEAIRFVAAWNERHKTEYVVVGPNLKVFVPPCTVPLKARWVPKDRGMSGINVYVICDKTTSPAYNKWEVSVPVAQKKGLGSN